MDMESSGEVVSTPMDSGSASEAITTPTERTFRQSEVDGIVKKVKHEAVEGYRRQQSEQPAYVEQKYSQNNQNTGHVAGSPLSESDYRRMAAEEVQKAREQFINEQQSKQETDNAQRIVNSFWDKVAPGKEKYDDFESVTGNIELSRFPNTVQLLAEHVDNSHDVLYELGKNRLKMSQLEQLSYMSPRDAIVEVQRLAQSIKDNETSSKIRQPNAPLSQQRPSNVGTDSGGALSMRELKQKYRA